MRRLLVLGIFLLFCGEAVGQGIAWERVYPWLLSDDFHDVIEAEPGSFIACGTRGLYRHFIGNQEHPVISIAKFDSQGDTLWVKNIGYFGQSPRICRGDGDEFYLVSDVITGVAMRDVMLFRIGFDGQVRYYASVAGDLPDPKRLIRATDGNLVYIGDGAALPGTGNQVDMVVASIDPGGSLVWRSRLSAHPYCLGNWIEETPAHTFLASGTAGSRIWAAELDTNGMEVRRQIFYQTPSFILFDEYSCVQQAPGGRYIVSGNMLGSSTNPNRYLACFSEFDPNYKVWGGEIETAYCLPPHINNDSSIVVLRSSLGIPALAKLSKDSSVIWDYTIQTQVGSSRQPVANSFVYQSDSSVIAIGKAYFASSNFEDFYLCRIRNVGMPYHAVEPVATVRRSKGVASLQVYPNPTVGPLAVYSKSREALSLFDLSGRKVLEVGPDASGTMRVDVSSLPAGMYVLRQGAASVRVVRL